MPAGTGKSGLYSPPADLLALDTGTIPENASILDVGTGANLIYPLIGAHEYGWRFTGSEISPEAIASARAIINANPGLSRQIRLRRQKESGAIFSGIIHKMSVLMRRYATRHSTILLPARRPAASVSVGTWGWGRTA